MKIRDGSYPENFIIEIDAVEAGVLEGGYRSIFSFEFRNIVTLGQVLVWTYFVAECRYVGCIQLH